MEFEEIRKERLERIEIIQKSAKSFQKLFLREMTL